MVPGSFSRIKSKEVVMLKPIAYLVGADGVDGGAGNGSDQV